MLEPLGRESIAIERRGNSSSDVCCKVCGGAGGKSRGLKPCAEEGPKRAVADPGVQHGQGERPLEAGNFVDVPAVARGLGERDVGRLSLPSKRPSPPRDDSVPIALPPEQC